MSLRQAQLALADPHNVTNQPSFKENEISAFIEDTLRHDISEETVVFCDAENDGHHDEVIVDEMWTFVGCKANDVWVWVALSRRNMQILAFHVGGRALEDARQLWQQVPPAWKECLVFTDGYNVYPALLANVPHKHCLIGKGEGQTSEVEGTNNALRQRVSYLVRRSAAFARSIHWLVARLHWTIHHWNLRQAAKHN